RAGIALDNASLHRVAEVALARAEAAATRIRRLQTILDAIFTTGSYDDFMQQLLLRLQEAVGADTAAILTVGERGTLAVRHAVGLIDAEDESIPFGQGVAGKVAATRTHLLVQNPADGQLAETHLVIAGVVSAAAVPLIADGALVGVLEVGSKRPRA